MHIQRLIEILKSINMNTYTILVLETERRA